MYRQFKSGIVYEELSGDPISQSEEEVRNVVLEIQICEQSLPSKRAECSQIRHSKLGRFYLLPNIHKGLPDVVGRPVISNCGTATEHILDFFYFHLNSLVSKSSSYIKETNHFLALLISYKKNSR